MSEIQVSNLHFESTGNNRIVYTGSNTLIAYAAGVEQWRANTTGLFFANTAQVKADLGVPSIESMAIHNLMINGGMSVSQENGTAAGNTTGYYPVDEFAMRVTGFDCDSWQSTETPSNNYSHSIQANVQIQDASVGSTDSLNFQQRLEGTFTRKLGLGTANAMPITVGFWSRCSTDLTYSYALRSSGTDLSFIKELTLTGNTWTWNTFTIPGTALGTWYSNTSVGIYQEVTLTTGSTFANATTDSWISGNYIGTTTQDNFMGLGVGNTFNMTGMVMLPGEHTIAAADAHKFLLPYDHELRRCQRYYETIDDVFAGCSFSGVSSVVLFQTDFFKEKKRAVPSMSYTFTASGGAYAGSTLEGSAPTTTHHYYYIYNLAASGGGTISNYRANARL